jgi:hypothetical protein
VFQKEIALLVFLSKALGAVPMRWGVPACAILGAGGGSGGGRLFPSGGGAAGVG